MKKKWIIPVIILAIAVLTVGGIGCYLSGNSLSFSTGRCIAASNGSYLILMDGPVVMSDRSGSGELFANLQTGDEILILHDGIQETYPGGTGVYYCKRLSEGSVADIPNDTLRSLSAMGWLAADASGKTREIYAGEVLRCDAVSGDEGNNLLEVQVDGAFENPCRFTLVQGTSLRDIDGISPGDRVWLECEAEESGYKEVRSLVEYQTVGYEYGYANMRLELPAGWAWEIEAYEENAYSFGICFWPEDAPEMKIRLAYIPGGFGVCGTGLEEEQIRLDSGYQALRGTYDNRPLWSFISIVGAPGSYVFTTENPDQWRADFEDEAMEIINSANMAENVIWERTAEQIARRNCEGSPDVTRTSFDFESGIWTVQLRDGSSGAESIVRVAADGSVAGP